LTDHSSHHASSPHLWTSFVFLSSFSLFQLNLGVSIPHFPGLLCHPTPLSTPSNEYFPPFEHLCIVRNSSLDQMALMPLSRSLAPQSHFHRDRPLGLPTPSFTGRFDPLQWLSDELVPCTSLLWSWLRCPLDILSPSLWFRAPPPLVFPLTTDLLVKFSFVSETPFYPRCLFRLSFSVRLTPVFGGLPAFPFFLRRATWPRDLLPHSFSVLSSPLLPFLALHNHTPAHLTSPMAFLFFFVFCVLVLSVLVPFVYFVDTFFPPWDHASPSF